MIERMAPWLLRLTGHDPSVHHRRVVCIWDTPATGAVECPAAFSPREVEWRPIVQPPQTLQQVVANAKPDLAAELYAASAIAITVDTDAEKQWLDMLAYGLRLDPQVRSDIDSRIAMPA